jgi:hypothetical protein
VCIKPRCRGVSNRSPPSRTTVRPRTAVRPPTHATGGNASRPPPLRCTPLRSATGRRTAVEARFKATPRGCGRGSAPYRRTPHEDAPAHSPGRNATAGKQSPDQGRAEEETRHRWNASRPPPLSYTPLRDLHSVPLRVVGRLSKLGSRPRHEGAEGGAPPTAVPPTKTRPNIYLTGTPTQGSKATIRETPRREQGTPCEAVLRPPPNGLRARRSPPPHR